jgi:hypothetical protein
MLEHLVAFGRLVFQKELIDDDCGICQFAQPGDPLSVNLQPNEFPLPVESYRVAAHSRPRANGVMSKIMYI